MQRGNFFFHNDLLLSAAQFKHLKFEGVVVYEVLRVIKGFPLFFDDHFARLEHSCQLIGYKQPFEKQVLYERFMTLISKNIFLSGNIKLNVIFNADGHHSLLYFIPHTYPSHEDYTKGVQVGFLEAERVNPEAKVEQHVREQANSMLETPGLYEVLLIDHEGEITEGSRSNVFFVDDNGLVTAPLEKVLKGITMAKVLDIAKKENIPVTFSAVKLADIGNYPSVFLTGTSPKILPVSRAGNQNFKASHPLVGRLMELYNKQIEKNIQSQMKRS
ncbi:MAG: aminotransferase class IV [Prolixibacteraceae bacterium]|nr:aminotransferase class IV [Prolixibacteraceae bacterium]